jgi:hypothetical protein
MKPLNTFLVRVNSGAHWMIQFLLSLSLVAFLGSVHAQNAPELSNAPQMEHNHPGMMGEGPWAGPHSKEQLDRMWAKRIERFDHRQAELKARLKITPAQESAWAQFVQAIRPPQSPPQPQMDREQMRAMMQLSAPQRMEKMMAHHEQVQAQMNQKMHEHLEAVKAFYPQLSSEQQKEFDRFTMHHNRKHWGRAKSE